MTSSPLMNSTSNKRGKASLLYGYGLFVFHLQVFQASTVVKSVVRQKLSQVMKARFVRFFPITYHGWPCLTVEVYVLTPGS